MKERSGKLTTEVYTFYLPVHGETLPSVNLQMTVRFLFFLEILELNKFSCKYVLQYVDLPYFLHFLHYDYPL